MTNDELKQAVPAAFSHKAHPAVSEKYSFVSTKKVIDMFEKHGWYPVYAKERKSKKTSDVMYNKHLLRFRRKNPLKIHGLEAEILHIADRADPPANGHGGSAQTLGIREKTGDGHMLHKANLLGSN